MKCTPLSRAGAFGAVFIIIACAPIAALAHPSAPGHTQGIINGVLHPLSGWDHLLAMLAVGIWSVQCGRNSRWMLLLAFVSAMVVGGIMGMTWRTQVPMLEQGIASTVLVLGLMLAGSVRVSPIAGSCVVALFALFHGYAHGVEMPETVAGWDYGLGFVLATVAIIGAGILAGQMMQEANKKIPIRVTGAIIAMAGLWMIVRG